MGTRTWPHLIGLSLLCACNGVIGSGTEGTGSSESFVCNDPSEVRVGTSPIRRLTNVEYDNTIRDLFGDALPQLPEQPTDALSEGTFENDALALGPSDVRISRYQNAAALLGAHAVNDSAARARVLPCTPASTNEEAACGRELVEDFGRRAFRRPLTTEEVDRWSAFFESQRSAIDFDAAVELTVTAILQAPQFIYRLEVGDGADNGQVQLTQHEIASRLSYLFWESMPDDELLRAADNGELSSDEQLETHARRLMADDRARTTIRNFHRQWLHLDRVLGEAKLNERYPMWTDAVAQSAVEESMLFAENVVFNGGTLSDLFTSNEAYVDANVAPLYDVSAPAEAWSPVTLPEGERSGILSRIAFLAGHAHSVEGSPPLRGVFVMERLLCEGRPTPPANADTSPPLNEEGEGPFTNRELFEQRTEPDECRACHNRIDGFGFGFEEYDAAGLFRELDNGMPVDASGFADGIGNDADYEGAVQLQALLADSDVVERCVVQKWLTYANGRTLEPADTCQVDSIEADFTASGGSFEELLIAMVLRPEFRLRSEGEQ